VRTVTVGMRTSARRSPRLPQYRPDETLFQRVAREHRVGPQPALFDTSAAGNAAYDADYVSDAARPALVRVLADLGVVEVLGFVHQHARLIAGKGAPLAAQPLDEYGRFMVAYLQRGEDRLLLGLDEWSFRWSCPSAGRGGRTLVDLGAWVWDCTESKAARRIAKLAGLAGPVPS
jgi:hypothetical protein